MVNRPIHMKIIMKNWNEKFKSKIEIFLQFEAITNKTAQTHEINEIKYSNFERKIESQSVLIFVCSKNRRLFTSKISIQIARAKLGKSSCVHYITLHRTRWARVRWMEIKEKKKKTKPIERSIQRTILNGFRHGWEKKRV